MRFLQQKRGDHEITQISLTFRERDCALVRIDGIQNSLISYLRFGYEAYLTPQIGDTPAHGVTLPLDDLNGRRRLQ